MGLSMYDGAVFRAMQFKTESTLWTAIGRNTVWTDEFSPDAVDQTAHDIEEVVTYVKPYVVSLCKWAGPGGDILVDGSYYDLVADLDAIDINGVVLDQDARYLYIGTELDPNLGQLYGDFRQIALYVNTVPVGGHESDDWLNPTNVSDPGTLCYLHNDVVTKMSPVRRQIIELVLEFK